MPEEFNYSIPMLPCNFVPLIPQNYPGEHDGISSCSGDWNLVWKEVIQDLKVMQNMMVNGIDNQMCKTPTVLDYDQCST